MTWKQDTVTVTGEQKKINTKQKISLKNKTNKSANS